MTKTSNITLDLVEGHLWGTQANVWWITARKAPAKVRRLFSDNDIFTPFESATRVISYWLVSKGLAKVGDKVDLYQVWDFASDPDADSRTDFIETITLRTPDKGMEVTAHQAIEAALG